MIAALASGVLGQIEGSGVLSAGSSALSAVFGGNSNLGTTTPPTAGRTGRAHGQHGGGQHLSDQVQSTLLQLQSDSPSTGTIQADDTGSSAANFG
jgi:hypothetical protein